MGGQAGGAGTLLTRSEIARRAGTTGRVVIMVAEAYQVPYEAPGQSYVFRREDAERLLGILADLDAAIRRKAPHVGLGGRPRKAGGPEPAAAPTAADD